ncbi:hypothetical protein TREAZ_1640 [Leadbettera azotonutricia ZAS-9]|uniref:Uncharacterized protein n=1 Tax=Leadbettera azotonutricia (strain ATCC BAA-888 / DSM 13862 / ZAS-9) TaxID=545695 RepID=F5YDB7_LEAAZ|nr:hypothetical protein TREAZ_1640 [Leadbettera azotonutricia ZAS-9]
MIEKINNLAAERTRYVVLIRHSTTDPGCEKLTLRENR